MWFETSVDIAAPADVVWQTLTDVERWPTWTSSMSRVTPLDPGPLAIGHRVKIKQPSLPTAVWTVDRADSRPLLQLAEPQRRPYQLR